MDIDSIGALEVLKQIKQIMDDRLGSRFAEKEDPKDMVEDALETSPDAKGLEVAKVKVLAGKGDGDSQGLTSGKGSDEEEEYVDGVDQELLKKIRQAMM